MHIKKIQLTNFRNYKEQEILFDKNINIFYGNNAQGKTNILEAIYLSAIGKSYRTNKDKELINESYEFSKVQVEFAKKDREGNIGVNISDKKQIFLNDIKLNKMSEILGNINVVLFNPDDINIFKDNPAARRKILDIMISQLRPSYVYNLNMYRKVLEQRNNYLKQVKFENKSEEMLEIWEIKLTEYAEIVNLYRKEFVEKIMKKIVNIHNKITNSKEKIRIEYISDFIDRNSFYEKIKKNRKTDILRGFTGIRHT